MERNGERRPPRPRIELLTEPGSDSEATAIVAALERFLAETAPAPPESAPSQSPWLQAAMREGVSRSQALAWGARSEHRLPSHPSSR
jgi:hypothetical protein